MTISTSKVKKICPRTCHVDKWEVEVKLHSFLILALDGSEWFTLCPSHFTPAKGSSVTHWIGGWVGPRANPDYLEKREISCPCWKLNHNSSVSHSLVSILTELSRLLKMMRKYKHICCIMCWWHNTVQWTSVKQHPLTYGSVRETFTIFKIEASHFPNLQLSITHHNFMHQYLPFILTWLHDRKKRMRFQYRLFVPL
jgi:hypothetical protein